MVFSRLGVYMRVPGVDAERFAEPVQSQRILGYLDTLSGGAISRVGIFSLGTAPASEACHAKVLWYVMQHDRRPVQRGDAAALSSSLRTH